MARTADVGYGASPPAGEALASFWAAFPTPIRLWANHFGATVRLTT
jgi:hypothetical protein